jgi:hypothetical protein
MQFMIWLFEKHVIRQNLTIKHGDLTTNSVGSIIKNGDSTDWTSKNGGSMWFTVIWFHHQQCWFSQLISPLKNDNDTLIIPYYTIRYTILIIRTCDLTIRNWGFMIIPVTIDRWVGLFIYLSSGDLSNNKWRH